MTGVPLRKAITNRDCWPVVVTPADDEPILVRLLVKIVFSCRWVDLQIVAVSETEHKGVAIAVKIGSTVPLFRRKGPKNVSLRILYHQDGLISIFQLLKESQVTVTISTCREQELPLAQPARPWQMVPKNVHLGL